MKNAARGLSPSGSSRGAAAPPTSPSTAKPSGFMGVVKVLYKNTNLLIVPHTGMRRPPRQQPRVRRRDEVRRQAAVLEAAEAVLQDFDEDVVHRGVVALSEILPQARGRAPQEHAGQRVGARPAVFRPVLVGVGRARRLRPAVDGRADQIAAQSDTILGAAVVRRG